MLDSLFRALFKFPAQTFAQGDVAFGAGSSLWVGLAVAVAAGLAALLSYRRHAETVAAGPRLALAALRLVLLALLVLCLARPMLVLRAAVPQRNFVGVILDDSLSMRTADMDGQSRGTFVEQQFGTEASPVTKALGSRFSVRAFRFGSTLTRAVPDKSGELAGTETRVAQALLAARDELAGLPLAGLVLVSDGADTTQEPLTEALLSLRSSGIPVFTVGIGQTQPTRDIQIDRVSPPSRVLKGSSIVVDVVVRHTGFAGAKLALNVEDEGRIISTEDVTLAGDGEPTTVRVHFTANDAGPRVLRFRVPPQEGETLEQNNVREALLDVRDDRERILYFEGEPRFEVGFLRRAVADDKNLQVVTLVRTADNKYQRIGVEDAEELAAGFPKTREELFSYRSVVLGSIEAGAFTGDQLKMLADFVDRRGGGLLTLGGRRAFGEGGYAGTPLADALPVLFDQQPERKDADVVRVAVRPTRAGALQAVTQIAESESASAARWPTLPELTTVNVLGGIKPGATALLVGTDLGGKEQVVLASHRYGRGKAFAFTPQDSWVWQMHAKIAVEDMTHETFWRQLMRALVADVPKQTSLRVTPDRAEPGAAVTLQADVQDGSYVEINDARVVAHVTAADGSTSDVPLQWTGDRNGDYRGTFVPRGLGMYEVTVDADQSGTSLGTDRAYLRAAPSDAEYFDAALREPLLQRVAEETGGRYYRAADAAKVADDIQYTGRGVTTVEERDLWDMPALLVLLLAAAFGEWAFRRHTGLA